PCRPGSTLFPYTTLFRSRYIAVEDVLVDQRLLGQGRDALTDGVLIGGELDLVVDADRDRVRLVASRDGRGFLRDDLLRVGRVLQDRKSTRLNSSHQIISY